jgi:hypothetical protein
MSLAEFEAVLHANPLAAKTLIDATIEYHLACPNPAIQIDDFLPEIAIEQMSASEVCKLFHAHQQSAPAQAAFLHLMSESRTLSNCFALAVTSRDISEDMREALVEHCDPTDTMAACLADLSDNQPGTLMVHAHETFTADEMAVAKPSLLFPALADRAAVRVVLRMLPFVRCP